MKTIFCTKKIITMDAKYPYASYVAVDDGTIVAVGDEKDIKKKIENINEFKINEQFKEKIIMPGFIEGHSHTAEGNLWQFTYCGYYDRKDPNGKIWKGLKNLEEVIGRLSEAEKKIKNPEQPLSGWQLDPIYFNNVRVSRHDLDKISKHRAIGILHASGHIMNVNSKALEIAGLLKTGIEHDGLPLGDDGIPTGELKGPEAMGPVSVHVGFGAGFLEADEKGLRNFAKLCVRTGTTTVTDLASRYDDDAVKMMIETTNDPKFPARVVPFKLFMGISVKDIIDYVKKIKKKSTEQLRLGMIKVVADGSIQGFSARMKSPGYYNGAENGLWYTSPEQMEQIYQNALENEITIHTHTNGDEATELALVSMEKALEKCKRENHRFTLQHCQLASQEQFQRIAKLGMCVNLFANHHFFWGDQHYEMTVGPERAKTMNACASALRCKIPMGIHSDAPITPLAPLFTAWCAVNRITASGRILGEQERISVQDALYAITMGAAYTLGLEKELGSIQVGKKADMAILNDDPTAINPEKLRDVEVWGTIQNGRIFEANAI